MISGRKRRPVENENLKDISKYRTVSVTELRHNLKDFVENDEGDGPIIVYRRSEPMKVLVDHDTWMQLIRNLDVQGNSLVDNSIDMEDLAKVLKSLVKK